MQSKVKIPNVIIGKYIRTLLFGCCKSIEKLQYVLLMVFNSQLINFYRTDSDPIFNIVLASLFYTIKFQPSSYLGENNKTKRIDEKKMDF